MRGRIGCDLDGVVADIVSQLVEFARRNHNFRLKPEQIVSEQAETCTPLSLQQLQAMFRERIFFTTMTAFSDARAALSDLRSLGFSVDIVTDRFWYPEIRTDTIAWLEAHDIAYDELRFVSRFEKHITAAEWNYRFVIEDQAPNALLLSSVTEVYLLDRPYNRTISSNERIRRVRSLSEVVGAVASLSASSLAGSMD